MSGSINKINLISVGCESVTLINSLNYHSFKIMAKCLVMLVYERTKKGLVSQVIQHHQSTVLNPKITYVMLGVFGTCLA